MVTPRRTRFVSAQLAMLLGVAILLASLETLAYDLFFLVALVGFLLIAELTAPFKVEPRWRTRLKWPIALGLVGFGYIFALRSIRIIQGAL